MKQHETTGRWIPWIKDGLVILSAPIGAAVAFAAAVWLSTDATGWWLLSAMLGAASGWAVWELARLLTAPYLNRRGY